MRWQRSATAETSADDPNGLAELPRALSDLFSSHFDDVYRFCLARSGSASRAEDAASETFADAARLFATERGDQVTVGWLFAVARRRVIDQWRASERERRRLERVLAQPDRWRPEPPVDDDDRVADALAALPDKQRAALILRYVDGCSVSEVSDALGLSYRATESTLARARQSFRQSYEESAR